MANTIYQKLANQLNKTANGFPKTRSEVEFELLRKLFSLEEAFVAGFFCNIPQDPKIIQKETTLPANKFKDIFSSLISRGLLWPTPMDHEIKYQLAPLIAGAMETSSEIWCSELSAIFEQYMNDGGAKGILGPHPPLQRIIPARKSVRKSMLFPYDNLDLMFEKAIFFSVSNCFCRSHTGLLRKTCDYPLDTCLHISYTNNTKNNLFQDIISRDKFMSILDKAETIGLVHSAPNCINGVFYICNCCKCCCTVLRGANYWKIETAIASSNYFVEISNKKCKKCGFCIDRCPIKAVSILNGKIIIDKKKCIGCGLCVINCPEKSLQLVKKEKSKIITPPEDFKTWQNERLLNRGLFKKYVFGEFSLKELYNNKISFVSKHIKNGIFELRSRKKEIKTIYYFFFHKESAIFTNKTSYLSSDRDLKEQLSIARRKRKIFMKRSKH